MNSPPMSGHEWMVGISMPCVVVVVVVVVVVMATTPIPAPLGELFLGMTVGLICHAVVCLFVCLFVCFIRLGRWLTSAVDYFPYKQMWRRRKDA